MSDLKALLFDVDGTLADTERDGHRVAFNRAFADAGLDWVWDVSLYSDLLSVTGGKERIRYYLGRYRPGEILPDEEIASLHAAKTRRYTRMLAQAAIPLRPGVHRLLDEARAAGLRLAIATTTTPANVTALIESTLGKEAIGWFEVIAAGDIVPAKKPAADIYEYVLHTMGLGPEECLAFEDSENGILSSIRAGLRTIITTNVYTEGHDFSGAILVIDNLGEPDQPFKLIRGDVGAASYVDIKLLKRLAS